MQTKLLFLLCVPFVLSAQALYPPASSNGPLTTALLANSGVDLGSAAQPVRNVYLYGAGTYGSSSYELTGTPSANRVLTLPDATTTVVGGGENLTSSGAFAYVCSTHGTVCQNTNLQWDAANTRMILGNTPATVNGEIFAASGEVDVERSAAATSGAPTQPSYLLRLFSSRYNSGTPTNAGMSIRSSYTADSSTGLQLDILNSGGTIVASHTTSGGFVLPSIHSTTGTRYLCVDTSGNVTASASACSGT